MEDTDKKVWLLYDQYRSGNATGGQGKKEDNKKEKDMQNEEEGKEDEKNKKTT